jgi:hypothetical protein
MEYTILLSVLVVALMVMYPMVKRSTQALIGIVSDQIGDQRNAEQRYTSNDTYMLGYDTQASSRSQTDIYDQYGVVKHVYQDLQKTATTSRTNMAFTAQEKSTNTDTEFILFEK